MKKMNLDIIEDEKIKIENAFNQNIEKFKKKNAFFKINKNDRHFVELVSAGYTLFAMYNKQYDDSIQGSYLEIGILKGVLVDGKMDILSPNIINIASKSYCFSLIDNGGWIENEGDVFITTEDLVEFWFVEFLQVLRLF